MNVELSKSNPSLITEVEDLKDLTVYEDKDRDVFIFNNDKAVYLTALGSPDCSVYTLDELAHLKPFTELDGSLTIFNG